MRRRTWGDPVATTIPGWLWLPGRMVNVCGMPRGRWLANAYRGQP